MIPTDFVYVQVFKGAINQGAIERCARAQAVICLTNYKKGKLLAGKKKVSVGDMINHHIKIAIKSK